MTTDLYTVLFLDTTLPSQHMFSAEFRDAFMSIVLH